MTPAIEYLRAIVAGTATRVWRLLTGGDCPCAVCREHRAFIAETDASYDEALRLAGYTETHSGGGRALGTANRNALVNTLDEARQRRGV